MSQSLRDLKLFVAVYEERSFTVAAEREHSTQSGVSQHIRKLENSLGVKLFERGVGVPVEVTPAAVAYYQGCIEILRLHAKTNGIAKTFGHGLVGNLSVGLPGSIVRSSFASSIQRFAKMHPNVSVRVTEADSDTLTEQVRSGNVEFAFVGGINNEPGMKKTPFLVMPEALVSRSNSGFKNLSPLCLSGCNPLKLIVPFHSKGRRQAIESYLAVNHVFVERWLEVDSNSGALNLVANSDWVTILPMMMLRPEIEHGGITVNMLSPRLNATLSLIEPLRNPISPIAEAFVDILREETNTVKLRLDAIVDQIV